MSLLDLIILTAAVSAAIGGWRVGFLARAFSWVGLAVGFVLATRFLPSLVETFGDANPTRSLLVGAAALVAGAFGGQAFGLVVGHRMRSVLPIGPARIADRTVGAGFGVIGVLVTLWLLLPALADLPGWPARVTRTSYVATRLDAALPRPPDATETLRRLVGESGFPQVFGDLRAAPDAGAPPEASGLAPDVELRTAAGTVKIVAEGDRCSRIQEGSGFVVADGVVVTNAHVVAGQERFEVLRPDGRRLDGEVAVFDPRRDLAVLRVPGLGQPALERGEAEPGAVGAVFGHPRGQDPVRAAPARVSEELTATGRDIYNREDTARQVYILASTLQPGDSGGPLVDNAGRVVGVAFAIAPDNANIAYALTNSELESVLALYAADPGATASTDACLA